MSPSIGKGKEQKERNAYRGGRKWETKRRRKITGRNNEHEREGGREE